MPGTYKTKQGDLILEALNQSQGQPVTLDDLVSRLAARGTPVGKTTIYRYMKWLEEQGRLRKYAALEKRQSASYQYIDDPEACNRHFHLHCRGCGHLFHAPDELLSQIEKVIFAQYQFHLDPIKTVFYGQCLQCERS